MQLLSEALLDVLDFSAFIAQRTSQKRGEKDAFAQELLEGLLELNVDPREVHYLRSTGHEIELNVST